ncbi:MAG: ABC transporter permease subunit [Acidimicrobiia bacterium]|nr:ABC transporter permease subunit [Acidimicrobiia bacterium]
MIEFYRGVWVVAYRDLLRFLRDRSRIAASVIFPLLFLAIFGAGFTNVVGTMTGGVDLIQFMYPGLIAMAIVTGALSAGISVVTDREEGFLREILVAPLSRTGIVIGKAAGAAGVGVVQMAMLLIIAPLVGITLDGIALVRLVPIALVLSFGVSGLGILLSSFIRSQQGVQMLIQLLVFPLVFLAGVFFPVDSVPMWMEVLSKTNPVTYGVDAIRQVLLGSETTAAGLGVTVFGHTMTVGQEVMIVGGLGVLLLSAAVWRFVRSE